MVGEELDLQDVLRFWVLNSNEWCIRITSPQEPRSLTYTWCDYSSTRLLSPCMQLANNKATRFTVARTGQILAIPEAIPPTTMVPPSVNPEM